MAKVLCGIYVTPEELRAVALKPGRGGFRLVGAGTHTLSPEEREAPGTALKAMLKRFRIPAAAATFCLPKEQTTLHHATLPGTDDAELKSMARFEAERHIPFNAERHGVGFQVLGRDDAGGAEVLLAAADGPVIDRAIGAARQARVRPAGLNVSSACLMNALLEVEPKTARTKTVVLVSIGLKDMDLVFSTAGKIVFSRSVPHGLRALIREWGKSSPAANMELDAARVAAGAKMIDMMDLDRVYSEGQTRAAEGVPSPGDAARRWAERVIQEIRRTYDFARREMQCPAIEAVVLAGEGAILRNLDKYLYVNLNVPAGILNPVAKLKGRRLKGMPFGGLELTVAYGAAIEREVKGGYRIDLTPHSHYKRMERRRLAQNAIVSGAIALIAFALGTAASMEFQEKRERKIEAYREANAKLRPLAQAVREDGEKLEILEAFFNDPTSGLRVLDYLAGIARRSDQFQLLGVVYDRGVSVKITGHAKSNEAAANLEEMLRNSDIFDDADAIDIRPVQDLRGRPAVYFFDINCLIPEYDPGQARRDRDEAAAQGLAPLPAAATRTETVP